MDIFYVYVWIYFMYVWIYFMFMYGYLADGFCCVYFYISNEKEIKFKGIDTDRN